MRAPNKPFVFLFTLIIFVHSSSFGQNSYKNQITVEEAAVGIKDLVGETTSMRLFHSYKSEYSERYTNQTWHSCNSSKILNGTEQLSFRSIKGNEIEGVLTEVDDCGTTSFDIKGRFDSTYVYLYRTDRLDRVNAYRKPNRREYDALPRVYCSNIQVYEIENGARLLKLVGYYKMQNGEVVYEDAIMNYGSGYNSNFRDSYEKNNLTFNTTYLMSETDDYLGGSKETPTEAKSEKSLTEKLKELKLLLDEGIITEDEFNGKKKELLEEF